ncbi:aldolase [Thozetella sp. PMI_491]|nr:aldolase [Thozetella sp. PMI_491]
MDSAVRIVEVGPRDGLQNISDRVPTEDKLELIRRLHKSGLRTIELTSVVSPKAVPQLQDCRQILNDAGVQGMLHDKANRLPVLVPNVKGAEIAIQHGATDIAVFVSATEGFSKANTNRTISQGLEASRAVVDMAQRHKVAVRGYVSCIFEDPYDGPTSPDAVLASVNALLSMGCYEVSLGDTLGTGSPRDVRNLLTFLLDNGVPVSRLAGHFHDTYGQALANVWEAYLCGVRVFDSSVAGLGGCPFAPGAKGNVATEDVAYMFQQAGIETGIDLMSLVEAGDWISRRLGKPNGSRAGTALAVKHRVAAARSMKEPLEDSALKPKWHLSQHLDGLLMLKSGVNLKVGRNEHGNALTTAMMH